MNESILIVDDDVMNIKTAQSFLKDEYTIFTATSGAMLFKMLEDVTPDLILLDIYMPKMDGFEVIKRLNESSKIPVIFLTAEQSPETETKALELGGMDFVQKPFNPAVLRNRISHAMQVIKYQKHLEGVVQVQAQEILEHLNHMNLMQKEAIITMANLIESRDGSTGAHVKRCGQYVRLIANGLIEDEIMPKIDSRYIELLVNAAYLHDIGKIKVPDAILQKPAKLTYEEFEIMKRHAQEGGDIIRANFTHLADKDYIQLIYDVATYHHEKWSGGGYPDGLSGEQIPLGARIMAIADVFDALISRRCYKDPLSFDTAFDIIEEGKGVHFDPQIAQCFLRRKEKVKKIVKDSLKCDL